MAFRPLFTFSYHQKIQKQVSRHLQLTFLVPLCRLHKKGAVQSIDFVELRFVSNDFYAFLHGYPASAVNFWNADCPEVSNCCLLIMRVT